MGMLDQMLANLYKPAKQENKLPLSGKASAQAIKALTNTPVSALQNQTLVSQGQFLRGEVMDLRAGQILVLLENGATVSARTEGTLNLSIGENARFFVAQTNEDQILLKHVREDGKTENPMIDKALTAAGITRTEKSVAIVTELLSHSQPVTGETIRHYLSLSTKYPKLPVKDFILMELHEIPVNAATVSQFNSYHDGNGKLLTQANTLIKELSIQMETLPEGEIKQQLTQEFTRLLSTGHEVSGNAPISSGNAPITPGTMPAAPDTSSAIPVTATAESSDTGTSENAAELPPDGNVLMQATVDNSASPSAPADVAIHTDESADLLQNFLDSFLLAPEEVADSDKVKEYYEELNYKLEALEQLAAKISETTKEPASTAPKQMKGNLSFMESINQVFPFLQLPLRFKEAPAHGELYVYERKKTLKPTDSFNALLHLDMDALGSMDVFIILAGQNVTSRFSLTDKTSADLIRSELPSLSEALLKKGYSLQTDVSVCEPETEEHTQTLLEQFLEEHAPGGLERYTFDIRA